ncbi:MAG: hypothetical protein HY890_01565 [Deltaproteobacteria bacterium]|nr:hypothetical protein [Deltaproteobacteria bacterium]
MSTTAPAGVLTKPRGLADLLDEAACRAWVLETLHPRGAHCPGCAARIEDATTLKNFWAGRRCACKCGRWFTALADTPFHGTQLSYGQICLIAALADIMATGLSVFKISAAAGVSDDTARVWIKKLAALNAGRSPI